MDKIYTIKDLIRAKKMKLYYDRLNPNFISATEISVTLPPEKIRQPIIVREKSKIV